MNFGLDLLFFSALLLMHYSLNILKGHYVVLEKKQY